jgi:hypothetical protein
MDAYTIALEYHKNNNKRIEEDMKRVKRVIQIEFDKQSNIPYLNISLYGLKDDEVLREKVIEYLTQEGFKHLIFENSVTMTFADDAKEGTMGGKLKHKFGNREDAIVTDLVRRFDQIVDMNKNEPMQTFTMRNDKMAHLEADEKFMSIVRQKGWYIWYDFAELKFSFYIEAEVNKKAKLDSQILQNDEFQGIRVEELPSSSSHIE